MPDFAGASLKLVATGEGQVIATMDRIDQRAQKLYTRLSDYEKVVAAEHLARMRQQEAADREYARSLEALAAQQKKYEEAVAGEWLARMRQASEGTEVISHSAARGLGELGRGLGKVAQSGQLGAFSLREFTGAAFRLGAEVGSPALGAAIGLSVLAIGSLVEAFGKSGEAAKKASEEFQHYIESLVHGSVVEASIAKAKLFSGDPTALLTGKRDDESPIAFQARVGGQQYLETEQARLKALVKQAQADVDASLAVGPGEGVGHDPVAAKNLKDYTAQLKEITGLLDTNDSQLARVSGVYDKLLAKEKELAAFQLEQKKDKVDSRSVAEYQNEELNRIVQRIKASHELVPALISEHDPLVALKNEQQLLRFELDQGNISVQRRIQLEGELARVTKEVNEMSQSSILVNGTRINVSPKAAPLPDDSAATDAIRKSGEKMQREADRVGQQIGHALTSGLTSALQAGSISKGFKAFTDSVLKGLGDMFAEIAEKALIMSTLMQKFTAFLVANPWLAAAAAVAMLAFAKSLGGSGSGGGGGGYSGSSSASYGNVIDRGYINPGAPPGPVTNPSSIQAKPSVTNVNYIIGPADPVAQRMFDELSRRSSNRGSLA